MVNIQKVKSWGSYLLTGFAPLITFIASIFVSDLLISIIASIIVVFFSAFIGRFLTRHPFREVQEGKGILILSIGSKGVIRPFIVNLNRKFITDMKNANKTLGIFDRRIASTFVEPKKVEGEIEIEEKEGKKLQYLKVPLHDYSKIFRFESFMPVFIYNEETKSFIDKEFLNEGELKFLTKYNLNYIKTKVEELSSILRDFARYVVELTQPKKQFYQKWWFWLVIALVGMLLIFLVIPMLTTLASPQTIQQVGGIVQAK